MVAEGETEPDPEFPLIAESTGLDLEQIDSLKKGFEGFDKEGGGTISQTTMQMILKSMGVKVDKDDMENYAGEVDEAATGQFSFMQFCQVNFAGKFCRIQKTFIAHSLHLKISDNIHLIALKKESEI